jgi:hypothetical protein
MQKPETLAGAVLKARRLHRTLMEMKDLCAERAQSFTTSAGNAAKYASLQEGFAAAANILLAAVEKTKE